MAANLSAARFGVAAAICNAFFFIGLDLSCRDRLHDAWKGERLVVKMAALIILGSAISYSLNHHAARVAIASSASFMIAAAIDFIAYQILSRRVVLIRMNGSNLFSALADSIVFPALAFGISSVLVVLAMYGAKLLGGLIWSIIFMRWYD